MGQNTQGEEKMIERFYYRLIDCQPWADAAKWLWINL
nr:MAG TPA: hypothetical protein [Caudoviricetes sp.]